MKIKVFFAIFFFYFSIVSGYGQKWEIEWEKQIGTSGMDMFADVIEDNSGGFTVLGSTPSSGKNDQDFWLVKFDAQGNKVWEKSYGTQNHDYPARLVQSDDGNYYLSGKTWEQENGFQAFILKADNQGNELWRKISGNLHNDCIEDIISMDDGGIVVAGTKSPDEKHENIWLASFTSEGELSWEKIFGETKMACAESLKKLPDGGFVLAGQIGEKGIPDSDLWVFRFNKKGEKLWDKQLNSPGINVWPECICCTSDSNLIVVGWHGVCMNDIKSENPIFDLDLFLAKISPQGKTIWTKNIDSEGSEGGNAVVVRPDGKILMAGKKETSFMGRIGPWLLLSDEKGTMLSEFVMPFKFNGDQAADIINTSDGGFVVIGPGKVDLEVTRSDGWIKKFKAF